MGTSKSSPTPSGGSWTPLKSEISRGVNSGSLSPERLVSGVIQGFGGLSPSPHSGTGGGAQGGNGGASRSHKAAASVGKSVATLAGFGGAIGSGGLETGLTSLGLQELSGKSPAEVVGRIAEQISSTCKGQQREIVQKALQDTILDAAALAGDGTYQELDSSLQDFIGDSGIEGLVELFLTNLSFDLVWYGLENHIDLKAETVENSSGIQSAVRECCAQQVREAMTQERAIGGINSTDWFGATGAARATQIATRVERTLKGEI